MRGYCINPTKGKVINLETKVIKNYLYNVMYQVLVIIVPLITTPYIARTIGANGVGAYSYTNSIVSYFVLFAGLGMSMYGQREIAYHQSDIDRNSTVFFEIVILKLLTVIASLTIFNIFILLVINQDHKNLYYVQEINIVAVFFDIAWFFQGKEDFKRTVIRNILVKAISVICIFTFIHTKDDVYKYALIMGLATLIGNVSLWPYLRKNIQYIKYKKINPFHNIRTIVELFIPMVATSVYNVLDKTMIGTITHSNFENGYYEQTTKIISVLMVIITSLGTVLLPRMAATFKNGKKDEFTKQVDSAYKFVIFISCPMCFGVIACSTNLVKWFLTPEFNYVSILLKIYAIVLLLIPLSNIAGAAVLTPIGKQNKGTKAVLLGALVNFVANIILINCFKSAGAAIATILAELAVTVTHFYYIREYISFRNLIRYFINHIIVSFAMMVVIVEITKLIEQIVTKPFFISLIQILIGALFYITVVTFVLKDRVIRNALEEMRRKKVEC